MTGRGWLLCKGLENGCSWDGREEDEIQHPARGVQVGGDCSRQQGLDTPRPHASEDQGKGVGSCLDIQQGNPLVLVATLPAVYHLLGRRLTELGSGPWESIAQPWTREPSTQLSRAQMERAEGRTRFSFQG